MNVIKNNLFEEVDQVDADITNLPLTAFDALHVEKNSYQFQGSFQYDVINTQLYESFTAVNGTMTASNSKGLLDVDTSIGSYVSLRSKKRLHYRPGSAGNCLFAASFGVNETNRYQAIGLASAINGFQIGYNNSTNKFGVLRSYGGKPEIRSFEIAADNYDAQDITMTINSVNVAISLTGGDELNIAYQIAATDFSSTGFYADNIGNKVIFTSIGINGVYEGSYTFSVDTSPSTPLSASFTQVSIGLDKTNEWIVQDDFNLDKIRWFKPTNINVFKISFEWLGAGRISFSIEDNNGEFIEFHRIKYANSSSDLSLEIASFPFEASIANLGAVSSSSQLQLGSASLFISGEDSIKTMVEHSKNNLITAAANQETVIISFKNSRTYNINYNSIRAIIKEISISSDLNKIGSLYLIKGCTLNSPEWTYINENDSSVLFDTNSTSRTGGEILQIYGVAKSDSFILRDLNEVLEATDIFSIAINTQSAGGGEVNASAEIFES